tara:strand:+ start:735 stop:914 length:180 start_codon:yes stop_codon:yes gene_type:complete
MKKAKLTDMVIVECPHCNGENELQFSDMGENSTCQYSHCEEQFYVPSYSEYRKFVLTLA